MAGDAVADCLVAGVIGGAGLREAVLTVVNDGLQAGVWGEGAVTDAWEAIDVE